MCSGVCGWLGSQPPSALSCSFHVKMCQSSNHVLCSLTQSGTLFRSTVLTIHRNLRPPGALFSSDIAPVCVGGGGRGVDVGRAAISVHMSFSLKLSWLIFTLICPFSRSVIP